MTLSKEQIRELNTYFCKYGIKWYDIRLELIDHFANILEVQLKKDPNLDFKEAIITIHKSFGSSGFKKLLANKTKALKKQFYKSAFKYFIGFFKLPRIILTTLAYWGLIQLYRIFDIKNIGFYFLLILVSFIFFKIIYHFLKSEIPNGKSFLILRYGILYLHKIQSFIIATSVIMVLNQNIDKNNIYYIYSIVGFYLLVTLFLISCKYVFHHLKQEIKQQFPNLKLAQ